jgi:hypothetical protein
VSATGPAHDTANIENWESPSASAKCRKQLHLARLRPRWDVAIAQTAAGAVVAYDAKAFRRQASEEMAESLMLPIALDVTYPPCRAEDERPLADSSVGDAGAVGVPNESNGLRWGH